MIFWINSPFDPLPLEGGRPMRYELLARALVGLGHEVVWWSSDFHHLRKEQRSLEPIYTHDGYQMRLIPTLPYHTNVSWSRVQSHRGYACSWLAMAVECIERDELQPPDRIILSMPPLNLFDQAVKFRVKYGCKIGVDVQDAWPENFYQLAPRFLRSFMGGLLVRFKEAAGRAYCGADCITAVAEKYLRLAASYGSTCPAKMFPLGGLLPEISKRGDGTGQRLRLIYVGNLGPSYDLKTMLRAVKALVDDGLDVSLDIAGDGPRRSEVEDAVKVSGKGARFHGYLSGDELGRLMQECDVGIIPMRDEMLVAVPNKLVDYATHGLAAINGLTSESKQLLEKFSCGISYEVGSQGSFQNAVMRYYNDRVLLDAHKRNARGMAEQLFDASKISLAMAEWLALRV
ncbi:MAG: glycosyltransferase [Kiritimatiellae bacterium]|nr:glycosyltransferase [Kiritimatiellia bacterium]